MLKYADKKTRLVLTNNKYSKKTFFMIILIKAAEYLK
jgi:hypothetical protein